jgi:chaperonin GroEL (HSP60 family)
LQRIALITGAKAITAGLDLSCVRISDLGQARKIKIDKNNTMVEGEFKCGHLRQLTS